MPPKTIKVKRNQYTTRDKFIHSLDKEEIQAMEIIKEVFQDAFWINQTNGYIQFEKENNLNK
jgi:hypothetical protein